MVKRMVQRRKRVRKVQKGAYKKFDISPKIAAVAILLIVVYGIAYSARFLGGPSFFADDSVYVNEAFQAAQGKFSEGPFIFSLRLMMIYPMAFFFVLFGVGMASSVLWDIFAFLATAVIVFLLGKELYSSYAGIIASLLLMFFPLVVRLSSTVSDDIVMMFISSFAFLALLYGQKGRSKWWYFLSGALFLASPLVTPEGLVAIIVVAVYLIVEIARRSKWINRRALYLVYGFVFAGLLLMLANYFLAQGHNPLVTLTVTINFYHQVGGQNTIPSTNNNMNFYIQNMFSYNVVNAIAGDLRAGGASLLGLWKQVYTVNYSRTGFYFYAMVIAAIYLLIRREKGLYYPLVWLLIGFLYLEFGFMGLSFKHPCENYSYNILGLVCYLPAYRLGRFLLFLAVPTVLILGIGLAKMLEQKNRYKTYGYAALSVLFILFIIATSVPINMLWYNILYAERYDQLAIANYLNTLPSSTKIYLSSSFPEVPIYMGYKNESRFMVYDMIKDCHDIPNGSYVVIPKYQNFNLNYTPNPRRYCGGWKLVLYPTVNVSEPAYISSAARPFEAKLYYVADNAMPGAMTNVTETANTTELVNSTSFNFINLTGVGIMENGSMRSFVTINKVNNVSININRTAATPNEYIQVNVIFNGNFLWSNLGGNATKYYLSTNPVRVINVHYFGVELKNQTGELLTQNNGQFNNYLEIVGEPHQYLYGNPNDTLLVRWIVEPSSHAVGKTLKLCGGYFAAFPNFTSANVGGWGGLFDFLSYSQKTVENSTAINILSNCTELNVT